MNKIGIDVSVYQGDVNWKSVKESGIDFAIIRCGYGSDITSQDDAKFERNVEECIRWEIPFGVYLYSYANTVAKAKSEARHVIRLMKNYKNKISYPVFYDLEDSGTTQKCGKKLIGDIAETFCDAIERDGYYPAIYASKYWFSSVLTDSRFTKWDKWVAQYGKKCTYGGEYTMWQYTSNGVVAGISARVDMNYCYVDYSGKAQTGKDSGNKKEDKPNVAYWQKAAIADGFNFPKYGTDGEWGSECEAVAKKAVVKKRIAGYKYPNLTKIVQKAVGVTADGKCGKGTKEAIIVYQKNMGLKADGCVGIDTWKVILGI